MNYEDNFLSLIISSLQFFYVRKYWQMYRTTGPGQQATVERMPEFSDPAQKGYQNFMTRPRKDTRQFWSSPERIPEFSGPALKGYWNFLTRSRKDTRIVWPSPEMILEFAGPAQKGYQNFLAPAQKGYHNFLARPIQATRIFRTRPIEHIKYVLYSTCLVVSFGRGGWEGTTTTIVRGGSGEVAC